MSVLKKKSLLSCALLGIGLCLAILFLCLLLGSVLLSREVVPESAMNIIVIFSVFISILISGGTISGGRGKGYLLCYAICAVSLIACMALVCASAGEKGHFGLWLLENSMAAMAAVLIGTFVQFRHNSHRKKRRK